MSITCMLKKCHLKEDEFPPLPPLRAPPLIKHYDKESKSEETKKTFFLGGGGGGGGGGRGERERGGGGFQPEKNPIGIRLFVFSSCSI